MNLVNELQISAERDDVLTVLRKTKRLASKLDHRDISDWLNCEQNGYPSNSDVPDYRIIKATIAINTNGYVPAGFGYLMKGILELPSSDSNLRVPCRDSISAVLSLIENLKGRNIAYCPIEDGSTMSRALREAYQIDPMFSGQVSFHSRLNSVQIRAIPERIKDRVLEWACDLECAGITGDGLSLSQEEKAKAHSITFNIHNSNIEQLNNMGENWKFTRE
jgi:hypothetical protein